MHPHRGPGRGIPPEKLARIGQPFFTTKENGNGLGMSVSFKIIEQHRGTVSIDSKVGEGTTIEIMLPVYSGGSGGERSGTA
ncbi:HAMP domain-containing histidine kinase [Paenibacillus sp. P25]|nr:HAMP domain-containing histidine kinase [Paenibacillus sp. P25]